MNCVICNNEIIFEWTDYHGEAICIFCQTPYQILHYEGNQRVDREPEIKIQEAYIPALQEYWNETKQGMGLGMYLGKPKYHSNKAAFDEWLNEHYPEPLIPAGAEAGQTMER